MKYDISVISRMPQHAAVVSGQVAHGDIGPFVGQAFGQVMGALAARGLQPDGMPFARFDFEGDGFRVEAGFPTPSAVADGEVLHDIELPGGEAATTMHVGGYSEVGHAYAALESWMGANGYESAGAPWESYLDGPEVEQPRTLVTWPCRRRP